VAGAPALSRETGLEPIHEIPRLVRAEYALRQVEDRMFLFQDVDPEQVDEVPGLDLELLVARRPRRDRCRRAGSI